MMDTFRWFEVGGEVEYQLSPITKNTPTSMTAIRLTLACFRTLSVKALFVCSSCSITENSEILIRLTQCVPWAI